MKFLAWITLLFIILFWYFYFSYNNFLDTKISIKNLEVRKWDNAKEIEKKLCKKNIVSNCLVFDFYLYTDKQNLIARKIYSKVMKEIWLFENKKIIYLKKTNEK